MPSDADYESMTAGNKIFPDYSKTRHTFEQQRIPPKGSWHPEYCEECNEHWSSDKHYKSTCEHGVSSPNRFRYCWTCRDNAAAHF